MPRPTRRMLLAAALLQLCFGGCAKAPSREMPEAPEPPHEYAMWSTLELDRCASAWLLKRYIDPKAEFRFYPDGTLDVEGVPFDMPTSEFRRTQTESVFEQLVSHHSLEEPGLAQMAAMVHAIEIDYWVTQPGTESRQLNNRLMVIVEAGEPTQATLEQVFHLFDRVLAEVRDGPTQSSQSR